MGTVNVDEWVELFRAIGLTDEDMSKWHRNFEKSNPDGHLSFLKWLGLSDERIKEVRGL
ncbi:MAG: hypothetical protein PHH49_08055 [Candidatus Omnitrophica bacterium]|nr:hypothetical protein [Candidatus Omnitrophota bacterium]